MTGFQVQIATLVLQGIAIAASIFTIVVLVKR